ncbi:MAG TPA: hypothetical protein VFC51_02680 [Chloroflexota bacterium]|nr:hypothetical protein [Chloroflexota bacterium]
MIGRLIVGSLAAAILSVAAVVAGFKGYQAYLRWLVAEPPRTEDQAPDVDPNRRAGSLSESG